MQNLVKELLKSRSDLYDHYADLIQTLHGLISVSAAMHQLNVDAMTLQAVCHQHVQYLKANTEMFQELGESNGTN